MESDKVVFEHCVDGLPYLIQPLHQVPSYINECCELINSEWKRSLTARLRSIEGSCENFPMSLILLQNTGEPKVIGHCKISRLSLSKSKLFVDTVVIHKNFRGKGLGKILMLSIEEIARRKQFKWIFLTTKGQEVFYEKLGYVKCLPVSIFGCANIDDNDEIASKVNYVFSNMKMSDKLKLHNNTTSNLILPSPLSSLHFSSSCPPPPPPLPSLSTVNFSEPCIVPQRTFMKKEVL